MFILTGCGNTKKITNNILTCTKTGTLDDGVNIDLRYEVSYENDYVTIIKSTEKIISDDESVLNEYKESVEEIYSPYKDIEYYDYNITINGNTLISSTIIDYSKVDIDKLIEIDDDSSLIEDGKIKLSDIKSLYESIDATCN